MWRPRRKLTHTAPPRPGDQGSPAGHVGACLGHDTDSRMKPSVFICAEIPALVDVLAVMMAATRQHLDRFGPQLFWRNSLHHRCGALNARAAAPAAWRTCRSSPLKEGVTIYCEACKNLSQQCNGWRVAAMFTTLAFFLIAVLLSFLASSSIASGGACSAAVASLTGPLDEHTRLGREAIWRFARG